jgi:hypothetical protein
VGGDGTIRAGSQFAENDPGALVSVLGYVTERLGIAIPVPCEDRERDLHALGPIFEKRNCSRRASH